MKEKLMEILAEPGTGNTLRLRVTQSNQFTHEIEEGELLCEQSGKSYPIVRGIPRFVASEKDYASNFGKQWNQFRTTQIDTSNGHDLSKRRFEEETKWTSKELCEGKWVLDAGCGAGRFSEVASNYGSELVAMDLSSAVEACQVTLAKFPNAHVVQGSILEPPFKAAAFDYAYCIGVIQHTPDPQKAVSRVCQTVSSGGQAVFTIYARRPWTKLYGKYLLRPLTKRMKQDKLLSRIESSMKFMFPLCDTLFRVPVLGKMAQFAIPVAVYVDSEHLNLTQEQRYEEAILDTFDMLGPMYDSPMKWQEVDSVFQNTKAKSWEFYSKVPINCVAHC